MTITITNTWDYGLWPLERAHLRFEIDQTGRSGEFPPHLQRVWERYTEFNRQRREINDHAEYKEAYRASDIVYSHLLRGYIRHLERKLDNECTCRPNDAQACPVCRARIAAQLGDEIPFSEKG